MIVFKFQILTYFRNKYINEITLKGITFKINNNNPIAASVEQGVVSLIITCHNGKTELTCAGLDSSNDEKKSLTWHNQVLDTDDVVSVSVNDSVIANTPSVTRVTTPEELTQQKLEQYKRLKTELEALQLI